jgi:hypothetical protein
VLSFSDLKVAILMEISSEAKVTNSQKTAVDYYKSIFLVCLFISLAIIYVASEYFQNARLSQLISFQAWDGPGPMPDILYPDSFGNHYFGDFLLTFRISQQASPYFAEGFVPFFYLPISAVLLGPFVLFNYWTALVLFFATCTILLVVILNRGLAQLSKKSRLSIISLFLISGPMVSMIDRGNVSLVLTLICLFAVLNLHRQNLYIAAIAFGLAAAMKGYPLLFLLIFVRRREWKQLAVGVSTFLISTLAPLVFYQKGTLSNFKELINQFKGASTPVHAINIRAFNHSLLSFLDTCRTSLPDTVANLFEFLISHYSLFGVLLAVILLSHAISKHASDFESLLLITVSMVTIPQTVGYYVLLLYFVPLIFCWSEELQLDWKMKLTMAALAVVMVPKGVPLWFPFGLWSPAAATYTSFLNPLCALFISAICVYSINRRRYFNLKKDFTEATILQN